MIVEGEIVDISSAWNSERTKIFTYHTVKIKNILKGIVSSEYIKIRIPGGRVEDSFVFAPHEPAFKEEQQGYFFISNRNNHNLLVHNRFGFGKISPDKNDQVHFGGLSYDKNDFETKIISETKFLKLNPELLSNLDLDEYNSLDTCSRFDRFSDEKEIEFTFQNVEYSENFSVIEFDIMAQVNLPGLKFGKGKVKIDYSGEFGEFVVSNNTVEITKGTILENDIYSIEYNDYSQQKIMVEIDGGSGSNNFFSFTDRAEVLLHVSLRIEDVSQLGLISLDDFGVQGNVYYWCNGEFNVFDNVNSSESITYVNPGQNKGIGLSYYFGNSSINEAGTLHHVDLLFNSSLNSQFVNGEIVINYNSLAFGDNILQNGKLEFRPSELFVASNYMFEFEDYDSNSLLLKIISMSQDNSELFFNLNEITSKLGELVIDIEDCDEPIGLSLSELNSDSKQIHFTGDYPIPFEVYSPVNLSSENNNNSCECEVPKITSFSPSIIPAGTGDILTITGSDFGEYDINNSTVTFNDGDGISSDRMSAGFRDFQWDGVIHWTDREIQVKVPSTDRNNMFMRQPAASGKIQVGNSCGLSDASIETLFIPYAIFNLRNTPVANPIKATVSGNESESICFSLSDQIPGWVANQFEIALNDWCAETSVNFSLGGTTSNNNSELDRENVISFESPDGAGLGALTNISAAYYATNFCADEEVGVFFEELDMAIVSGITSPTINDELDMREKIKHELGHMLMLNHSRSGTTEFQYLMFTEGNLLGDIKSQDSEGANLIFDNSLAILNEDCGFPIGFGSCNAGCITNGVFNVNSSSNSLIVFPNPTNEKIAVFVDNGFVGVLEIVDINGRLYYSKQIKGSGESVDIVLPKAQGVYLIKLKDSLNTVFAKVIKQ